MKGIALLFFTFCLFSLKVCYGQKNLLNLTEGQIKSEMPKYNASLKGTNYTDNGTRILLFNYPLDDKLLLSAFYIDDAGYCRCCVYIYKNDTDLNNLVKSIKYDIRFEKVPDKFEWVNNERTIDIKIIREHENEDFPNAFSIVYNKIKLK